MKVRISIYIIVAMILFSCNRDKSKSNVNSELLSINIDSLEQGLNQKILIDSVLYIPLETHTNGLISDIEKIIYADNKFFILDRKNRNGIIVFSDEGSFISTIGTIGRGPSEFIHISNFDIYNNKVYIYDKFLNKIIIYNFTGEYIAFHKIPNTNYDFSIMDSTNVLLFWTGSVNEKWKQVTTYNLLNKSFSNEIPIHNAYSNNMHASPYYELSKHLFRSGRDILFNTYFSNIIYKSSNDSIIPYLSIKSKDFIKDKDVTKIAGDMNNGNEEIVRKHIIILKDIFQTEDFLIFSIKNNNPLNIVYNIKTKKYSNYSNSWKNMNLIDISKIYGVKNDMFFSVVDPQLFYEKGKFDYKYLKHFTRTNHTKDFTNNGVNSNPVIAIFKFKEF